MKPLFLLALLSLPATGLAADDTRYVRDWISVSLRAGPGSGAAVVQQDLRSGTPLTLLGTDAASGMARVRTAEGVEGWLSVRYLADEPIARDQLERARAEAAELRGQLEAERDRQASLPAGEREARARIDALEQDKAALQRELEALRNAPGGPAQLAALQERHASLRAESDRFQAELEQLRAGRDTETFRNGALAVLAGALLALVTARLWPRRRSEWR